MSFVQVKRVEVGELPDWVEPDLVEWAHRSDPLLTYHFGDDLIAIVGFVPQGLYRESTYLWMQSTPATEKHPLAVAMQGKLTIDEMLKRYPTITGHCMQGAKSIRWLSWLGARFEPPVNGVTRFVIES